MPSEQRSEVDSEIRRLADSARRALAQDRKWGRPPAGDLPPRYLAALAAIEREERSS